MTDVRVYKVEYTALQQQLSKYFSQLGLLCQQSYRIEEGVPFPLMLLKTQSVVNNSAKLIGLVTEKNVVIVTETEWVGRIVKMLEDFEYIPPMGTRPELRVDVHEALDRWY